MAEPSTITRADVGLRSERGPVLLSVMLSVGLVAIDSTILATAVPSVVADLGGFAQFPWLFSIFLLAQSVAVPVFGKLSDQYGRKPIMLVGVGAFLLGSILCGLAWSMPALIAFRALQGVGAGAVQPTAMTIIGDIYSVAERAKVQGYIASVWAVSAVIGPTLGGLFVDFASWRWIFFVNIPLALLAGWVLVRKFHEKVHRVRHQIDYLGAALLIGGTGLIILGLLEGGVRWPWASFESVAVIGGGVLLIVCFALVERRASEPVIPGWIVRRRLLNTTNLTNFAVGALLIGLTSYIPLYVQVVLGTSALVAGFALAALTIGWPIAASTGGRIYLRIGFKRTCLLGSGIVLAGAVLLALLTPTSSVWAVALLTCFVLGLGLGWVASPALVAAQASVDWSVRGVVTGTAMFARSMGSAVGIAVFGAIVNHSVGRQVGQGSVADLAPAAALASALHLVFLGSVVIAVLMLVAVSLMPKQSIEQVV